MVAGQFFLEAQERVHFLPFLAPRGHLHPLADGLFLRLQSQRRSALTRPPPTLLPPPAARTLGLQWLADLQLT